MKKISIFLFSMIAFFSATAKEEILYSPDKNISIEITDQGQLLSYSVSYKGNLVVLPSSLGIKANLDWKEGLSIDDAKRFSTDTTWTPVYGERSQIRDHFESLVLSLSKSGTKDKLKLEVRAYDEGVAFRYCFPGGQYLSVTDEYTEFTLPEGAMAWHTERAQTVYNKLPIRDWPSESDRPLLVELPTHQYLCLAEAEVVDYVRTKFKLSDKKNTIATSMYGPVDDVAPFKTPWRVIMCAEHSVDIIANNDLILNLNEPCAISDPSWIRPGKVMREVTLSTQGGKDLVDFAVKRNLQYIHFDAGWYGFEYDKESDATTVTLDPRRNKDQHALDLQEVIAYAKTKGIGVIVYVNQRALQQQLDEILPLYKKWGIAGIKFGFVQVGSQKWTSWMHEAVRKCAEYGLMVDIHDEYRPTGYSRTYPNLMTQEGIRGNEEFPDATHNVTLPFTRYVAGAADYTICYYRQDFGKLAKQQDDHGVPRSKSIQTTPAHQLAMSVVYYSPLQYMYWYDKPSDSQDEPELKFFDDVYTTWDDTRILQGEVGEYISVARRHGQEWFVGNMAGNKGREITVSLDFLESGQSYLAEIYTDGDASIPTRTKVKCETRKVSSKDKFTFVLKNSGGSAIRLVPINKTQNNTVQFFPLSDVRLLDSRFRDNMERDSAWMCSLPTSRLLHSFRNTAGVYSANEGGYGEYASQSVAKLGGWESLDCDLRGHSIGHLLSAFSQMYASTGKEIFKLKGDSLVSGLREVQDMYGTGYLSAYPEGLINRNIEGKSVWAPWYTLHKILAGLIDQYCNAGNAEALTVAEGMADWAYEKLHNLSEQTRLLMIRNEFGGINEAFYNLYAISNNPHHRWLAEFFYHNDKIDPLKAHNGDMGTMHTNTFIPKVIAEARNYEINSSEESRDLCEFFWHEMIDHHVLAPGCLSDKEHFFNPNETSKHLSGYTGETCCTYNLLKLTRHLAEWNPKAEYMDYYEKALYNQILGQQDPESGMVCYFIPLLSGAHKLYSTYDQSFWCCVGSGFENHAKYGESIYMHSTDNNSLYVNLFIPSSLDWKEKGMKITQKTNFPNSNLISLEVEGNGSFSMRIRKPSWTNKPVMKVNGKKISVSADKDGYLVVSRNWKSGDKVEGEMPMQINMVSTPDDPNRAALYYGPILLAGELGIKGMEAPAPFSNPSVKNDYYTYNFNVPNDLPLSLEIDKKNLQKTLIPIDGKPLRFQNNNGTVVSPLYDIHRQRYVVYWNIK